MRVSKYIKPKNHVWSDKAQKKLPASPPSKPNRRPNIGGSMLGIGRWVFIWVGSRATDPWMMESAEGGGIIPLFLF